jgi:hypothetical protein
LSGQPWLIGVTGLTDVALYFDVALISVVIGAVGVLKTAADHLARIQPWRLLVRGVRAPGARRRCAVKVTSRSSSDSDPASQSRCLA